MQPTPPHTTAASSLAAAVLWASLSATAVLNKTLLPSSFPFPLTLAFCHMVACWLAATVAVHSGVLGGPRPPPVALRSVAPVGVLFAASLALSNAAFAAGVSVSGAQALKAATSPCVYALSVAAALDTWTPRCGAAVFTILLGVAIASTGEAASTASTPTSVALQAGAVAAEASRLVLLQTLLSPRAGQTPITTLHAVAPVCAAALSVPWAALEARRLGSALADNTLTLPATTLAASCAVAVALNLSAAVLIQHASALALTIAGVVKDWALVAASALLFGAPLARATVAGYALSCAGVASYNRDAWVAGVREARAAGGKRDGGEGRALVPRGDGSGEATA